jgi:hypothetical protein
MSRFVGTLGLALASCCVAGLSHASAQVSNLGPCSGGPQVMYVADNLGKLWRLTNYTTTPIVPSFVGVLGQIMFDIAVHPVTGQMYGCTATDLYAIDKATGATTLIGPLAPNWANGVNALDFSSGGVLYGRTISAAGDLVTIDLLTAQPTVLFPTGDYSGGDLAVDGDGTIYATNYANLLQAIDPVNGTTTNVGALATALVWGLDIDCDGTMYGVSLARQLYKIDKSTAAVTLIGTVWVMSAPVYGMAFTRETEVHFSYCTAGTTSHGCTPSISGVGIPSASASSGFQIHVVGVEGQAQGLLFYGASGQLALPWSLNSSSFLCVRTPIQRTTVQNSGGAHLACDGAFTLDWNAFMAANPAALGNPRFVAQNIDTQAWFRDPPAPKTTNLSDALHFVLSP